MGPQDFWAGVTALVLLFGGIVLFALFMPPSEYRCDNSNYPTGPCAPVQPEPAPTGSVFRCPTDWWEYRRLGQEAAFGCAMTRPTPLPCPTTPDTYWVAVNLEELPPGCSRPQPATVSSARPTG